MKIKINKVYNKFWIYTSLLGNLDINKQIEIRPLSFKQFKRVRDKDALIDLCRKMLYNEEKF